ncbi:MAG: matrixin family metalloprotease [Gemmatimonadaceae bacterium]
MKRLEGVLLGLIVGFALFVGIEATRAASPGAPPAATAEGPPGNTIASDAGAIEVARGPAIATAPSPTRSDADRAEIRRLLRIGSAGTYIAEILRARDSSLARWPDRRIDPLRVWVQQESPDEAWNPQYPALVRTAFRSWSAVGIPVRFTFVVDSAAADVRVTWIDRFRERISGQTNWARNDHWWIVDGSVKLALHHTDGTPLDTAAVSAIALHEVGHLIGLDHTADTTSIMAARVRVREISPADRATAHLLYSLPAGPLR